MHVGVVDGAATWAGHTFLLPAQNLLLITLSRNYALAHAPLLPDQVRNPRAGPQRRFIAPSFRTLAQELLQLLALGLAQTRLANSRII